MCVFRWKYPIARTPWHSSGLLENQWFRFSQKAGKERSAHYAIRHYQPNQCHPLEHTACHFYFAGRRHLFPSHEVSPASSRQRSNQNSNWREKLFVRHFLLPGLRHGAGRPGGRGRHCRRSHRNLLRRPGQHFLDVGGRHFGCLSNLRRIHPGSVVQGEVRRRVRRRSGLLHEKRDSKQAIRDCPEHALRGDRRHCSHDYRPHGAGL